MTPGDNDGDLGDDEISELSCDKKDKDDPDMTLTKDAKAVQEDRKKQKRPRIAGNNRTGGKRSTKQKGSSNDVNTDGHTGKEREVVHHSDTDDTQQYSMVEVHRNDDVASASSNDVLHDPNAGMGSELRVPRKKRDTTMSPPVDQFNDDYLGNPPSSVDITDNISLRSALSATSAQSLNFNDTSVQSATSVNLNDSDCDLRHSKERKREQNRSIFVQGFPKDWKKEQVFDKLSRLGIRPLDLKMNDGSGQGLLFFSYCFVTILSYAHFLLTSMPSHNNHEQYRRGDGEESHPSLELVLC